VEAAVDLNKKHGSRWTMERNNYYNNHPNEDRQSRRNMGNSDRYSSQRYQDDDDRFNREERFGSDYDYDRAPRSVRYASDHPARPWSQSNGFGSSGSENYSSQFSEHRPNRYDNRPQRAYNEYDSSFDSHLGARYPSRSADSDRTPSHGSQGSFGLGHYGSNQNYSQGNYGSQRPGSYGQNSNSGNSQYGNGQQYGGGSYGQSYGSSSNFSQYGQPSFNSPEQQWSRGGSSLPSKSGRAPKGYKRSDDRIKEDLSDLLTSHHEIDPSEVEIKVQSAEITLTGTVESRQEKRLIEDLASSISGVSEVTNQLRVLPSHDSSRSSQEGMRSGQASGSSSQSQGSQQSSKSIQ